MALSVNDWVHFLAPTGAQGVKMCVRACVCAWHYAPEGLKFFQRSLIKIKRELKREHKLELKKEPKGDIKRELNRKLKIELKREGSKELKNKAESLKESI